MVQTVRTMLGVACGLVWASLAVAQGLYWETKISTADGGERVTQNEAMPKKARVSGGDGRVMIIRADQDKMLSLDTRHHTYYEMTFAELETSAKRMQAQMETSRAQLERQMQSASPQQRAMMERALPKLPPTAPTQLDVKKTGETKTIAGHTCTKYVATDGGKTVLVTWTAADVKDFQSLREDWLAYQKRMAGGNGGLVGAMAEAYTKIDGFPMETQMDDVKTVVTRLESRSIPPTDFEVPPGYKKESPPMRPAGRPSR